MKSPEELAVATAVIQLMNGVVYRETHEQVWETLGRGIAGVRDHFDTIGVDVVVDAGEGYAFLRARDDEDAEQLPRLVRRRKLSFPVSLLLVLLRKRMVEFESSSTESRLILTRDQLGELLALFLRDSTNEARQLDQIDTTIRKVVELGFLQPLRGQRDTWEVRRILKAYVDAQTLSDFSGKLAEYREHATGGAGDE